MQSICVENKTHLQIIFKAKDNSFRPALKFIENNTLYLNLITALTGHLGLR